MSWISETCDAVIISLRVVPRASKNEFCGEHDGALKLRITAPPVDGKANKAIIAFLAKKLGVAKAAVVIISGDSSKTKRIKVTGLSKTSIINSIL